MHDGPWRLTINSKLSRCLRLKYSCSASKIDKVCDEREAVNPGDLYDSSTPTSNINTELLSTLTTKFKNNKTTS